MRICTPPSGGYGHRSAGTRTGLRGARLTGTEEGAVRYMQSVGDLDVRDLLSRVRAPTLVMHVRDELTVPIERGRELAAGIPGARFVALPGKNHVLLEQDPGLPRFFEELTDFLKNSN